MVVGRKEPVDNEIALNGNVIAIPFSIVNEKDGSLIKKTTLYVHIKKYELIKSETPKFSNITLIGVYEDGSFQAHITDSSLKSIFTERKSDLNEQIKVINDLFPIDGELNYDDQDENNNLNLEVRLITSGNYYDSETKDLIEEENDPNQSPITISIRTNSKIPVLIGSINLEPVSFDEDDLKDEGILFNWLDLVLRQNMNAKTQLKEMANELEKLKDDNYKLRNDYDFAKREQKDIVTDLETKFYQVLNAKKDRIWELLKDRKGNISNESLPGLNAKFVSDANKLKAIDRSKIADKIDDKYLSPTKRKKSKPDIETSPVKRRAGRKPTSKRAKGRKSNISESDEEEEYEDERSEHEDKSEDDLPPSKRLRQSSTSSVKVKEEPNSLELRDDDTYIEDDSASRAEKSASSLGLEDRQIVDNAVETEGDDDEDVEKQQEEDEQESSYNGSGEEETGDPGPDENNNEIIEDSLGGNDNTDYGSSDEEEVGGDQKKEASSMAIQPPVSQNEVETDYSSGD